MGRDFRPDFHRNGGYHDRERAYSPPGRYSPKDRYSPEPPEELEKRRSVRSASPARRDADRRCGTLLQLVGLGLGKSH